MEKKELKIKYELYIDLLNDLNIKICPSCEKKIAKYLYEKIFKKDKDEV